MQSQADCNLQHENKECADYDYKIGEKYGHGVGDIWHIIYLGKAR